MALPRLVLTAPPSSPGPPPASGWRWPPSWPGGGTASRSSPGARTCCAPRRRLRPRTAYGPRWSRPTCPTTAGPRCSRKWATAADVDVLVNNAGLSTTGAVTAATAAELRMIGRRRGRGRPVHPVPARDGRARPARSSTWRRGAFQPLPGQAGYAAARPSCSSTATPSRRAEGHRRHRHLAVPRPGEHRLRRSGRLQRRGGRGRAAEVHVGGGRRRRQGRVAGVDRDGRW